MVPATDDVAGNTTERAFMARAGVVVAVATLLIGSTGAGILAGGVLFAGAFYAWTSIDTVEVTRVQDPPVVTVAVAEPAPVVQEAPVAVAATPPAPPRAVASTSAAPAPRASTTTRAPKPTPRTAEPSDDLLADEDEWEAMGFDDAPDTAPKSPEEDLDDDEDLDAILEDLDAEAKPMRRGR